jgi:ApaG protein
MPVSDTVTQGVRVSVKTSYVPEQSAPRQQRYVFAYTIRITNEGKRAVQLVSRHWVITHGTGRVEEVRGPGVVGAQPRLEPGQHFEYTSGCVLSTPHGTMHGSYEMRRDDQSVFRAAIAPFSLSMPYTLN